MLIQILVIISVLIIVIFLSITLTKENYTGTQFYTRPIPVHNVNPCNTKCSLNRRYYGGNQILTFQEYLNIVNETLETMKEDVPDMKKYNFRDLTTTEYDNIVIPEGLINNYLNTKLNNVPYDKISYDGTCEEFSVQDVKATVKKCSNTGAYLYNYLFTLHNAKRESSLNTLAELLYDNNELKIIDIKTSSDFATDNNGYECRTGNKFSKFKDCLSIDVKDTLPPGMF